MASTSTGVPSGSTGTHLRLEHAGFATADARDQHLEAWPHVLAQLDDQLGAPSIKPA